MSTAQRGTCDVCVFWERATVVGEYGGFCKRRAPAVRVIEPWAGRPEMQPAYVPVWPRTHDTSWCGDFEAKVT